MIQIGDAIVSLDIIEQKFCCDLKACLGECCVIGDSGAPLEASEEKEIADNYPIFKEYMKPEGIRTVTMEGFTTIDDEGDLVTPLIDGGECAYAIEENGICWCAIEKAWVEGKIPFRKPISCHLYPIRIKKYSNYEAVNYNKWYLCVDARLRGEREGVPVYRFLKDALIRKYGEAWYEELCTVAGELPASGLIKK